MTSVKELRDLALSARRENSSGRRERYFRARDEAFEILTDGVIEKILNAAKEGRFKYPIYRWTNTSRFKKNDTDDKEEKDDSVVPESTAGSAEVVVADGEDNDAINAIPEASNVVFGSDADGSNGLHIMTLMQPTGIQYEDTLVAKLREFFNTQINSGEDSKENQLRVFLQRRSTNYRQCAIFVSWDRPQTRQQVRPNVRRPGPFVRTPNVQRIPSGQRVPYVPRETTGTVVRDGAVEENGQMRHPFKQFSGRGGFSAPVRGRPFVGRGRGRPASGAPSN